MDVESPSGKVEGVFPQSSEGLKKTDPSVVGISDAKARVAQLQKKCLIEKKL